MVVVLHEVNNGRVSKASVYQHTYYLTSTLLSIPIFLITVPLWSLVPFASLSSPIDNEMLGSLRLKARPSLLTILKELVNFFEETRQ